MTNLAVALAAFLAGYAAAIYGYRNAVEQVPTSEVERRTRPNLVRLTPREQASLRTWASWQVDPDLLTSDKAGA